MKDINKSDLGRRRLTLKIDDRNSVISCTIESVFMNVNNRKLGLSKRGECLNKRFYSFLSYSFHRLQLTFGTNKNLFSLFMISEPPNLSIISFIKSAFTYNGGTVIDNGWAILKNPVNYRIVVDQKVPQVMIDPSDVWDHCLRIASVSEYLKNMVFRSQLPHPVGTLSWLGRLCI